MSLYRLVEEGGEMLRLRLYHRGGSLPLSDVLPILENLGLRVVTERPNHVRVRGEQAFWIQEFSLIYSLSHDINLDEVKDEFEDAFARIWFGQAESDSFNRLLLGSRGCTQLHDIDLRCLRVFGACQPYLHFSGIAQR